MAARVAATQELLEAEVARLIKGEDWVRFLGFQARLHRYSSGNTLLIVAQHSAAFHEGRVPDPERRTWPATRHGRPWGATSTRASTATPSWRRFDPSSGRPLTSTVNAVVSGQGSNWPGARSPSPVRCSEAGPSGRCGTRRRPRGGLCPNGPNRSSSKDRLPRGCGKRWSA